MTFHSLYALKMIKFIIENKNYFHQNKLISSRFTIQKCGSYSPCCNYKFVNQGPRNQVIKIYNKFINYKIINGFIGKEGMTSVTAVKK